MQLLALAILSLVTLSYAAPSPDRTGPCAQKIRDAEAKRPGGFVPQCTLAGYYQAKQCHGSTGFCWCVNPDTGNELEGTRVGPGRGEPMCPPCYKKRAAAMQGREEYVPVCDEYGLFIPTQKDARGQKWCVDRFSGEKFEEQDPNECTGSRYCKKNETRGRPCCEAYFKGASSVYRMECMYNGYFKTEQVIPFNGQHFCVNPASGYMARQAVAPACGACFKRLEKQLGSHLLGLDFPQCDDLTGEFEPVQKSHEGYRWCVDPKTGEVKSENRSLDDKTPLPCEQQ